MKRFVSALAVALAAAVPVAADIMVKDAQWELGMRDQAKPLRPRFEDIQGLHMRPGDILPGPIRFTVMVGNDGPDAAGVLVRYAFSVKLSPVAGGDGMWSIPFEIGECRVPMLRKGAERKVVVEPQHLATRLKHLYAQGFWADAVKVEVMLDPRAGDDLKTNRAEAVLPIHR